MEHRATKDYYERENEEAERLVRPAPKVKPPRKDRRREETRPESDPDVDTDPDTNRDPDLSMNYKSIGGSTGARVLARFLRADLDRSGEGRADLIKVRKKDTGKVTYVTKDHLKEDASSYEVVGDDAEDGGKEPDDKSPEEKKEQPGGAEKKPADEEKKAPAEAEKKPEEKPADDGEPEDLTPHVRALADHVRRNPATLNTLQKIVEQKGFMAGLPEDYPVANITGLGSNPLIKPFKTMGDLREAISQLPRMLEEAPPPKPKKKAPPGKPKAPPPPAGEAAPAPAKAPEKAPEAAPEKGPEAAPAAAAPAPDMREFIEALRSFTEQAKALGAKPKAEKKEPTPEEKAEADAKKKQKDSEKAQSEAQKKELSDWVASSSKDKQFQEWAADLDNVKQQKDGSVHFYDPATKEMVPLEKLSPKRQLEIKQDYAQQTRQLKTESDLREKAKNPKVMAVLKDLANPNSDLVKKITEGKLLQKDPARVEGLKGLDLPESANTVEELMTAAAKVYKAPPEPERPTPSEEDRERAKLHIIYAFPKDMANQLIAMNLHPNDVNELLSTYNIAKSTDLRDVKDALELVGDGENYETDPAKVRVPSVGVNRAGQKVPFDQLTPEEQGEAYRKHQMRTVALSLAARQSVADRLAKKADLPEDLAGKLADFKLKVPANESEDARAERSRDMARNLFEETLQFGTLQGDRSRFGPRGGDEFGEGDDQGTFVPGFRPSKNLSSSQIKSLFKELGDDEDAKQVAVGYLQAADYLKAREDFLDGPGAISEHQSPKDIWSGLKKAMGFFAERAKQYPKEAVWANDPAVSFRRRVLDKIHTLSPEKYPFLQKWNEEYEDEEYDRKKKEWESLFEKGTYRHPGAKPPVEKPQEPPGYKLRHSDKKQQRSERQRLLDEQREALGLTKQASAVAFRALMAADVAARFQRYSSCSPVQTMASENGNRKNAVYWGVQPYPKGHEGFAPYEKWTQIYQRDLTERDYDGIVSAAREWLKMPVLSSAVDGIVRDTQLRAALDLAIRTHAEGRYSVGLQPPVYNQLLARLAGKPQDETLLTVRAAVQSQNVNDSLYASTGEEPPMKASAQITAFAAKVAATNPSIAYELIDLAAKVAQEEQQAPAQDEQKQAGQVPPEFLEHQKGKKDEGDDKEQSKEAATKTAYTTLRSHVIKMAHANPHLREAYLPLLQTIKQLG